MTETYKWQKLLWSVVIITIIAFFLQIVYSRSGQGPGAAFVLLLVQPYLLLISLIIILLRLFRLVITRYSFIYIFLGTINLILGITGLYLGITSKDNGGFLLYVRFAILSALVACFIFFDVFIKEITGFRNSNIKP